MTHPPPYLTPLVKIKFRPNLYMQPAGPADNDILFFGRFSPKLLFDIFLGQILVLLSFFCMIINVGLNVDYYILQAWHVDTCRSKNYILIRKRSNIRHII